MAEREDTFVLDHKLSRLSYLENIKNLISRSLIEKIDLSNVVTYHQFARTFQLEELVKKTFSYMQRCFTMICKTENFTELDFVHVQKMLSSSELDITSEVEVLKSVKCWLAKKYTKRVQFAKDLLFTVRLPLLSDHVLKKVLGKSSVFKKSDECKNLIKEILEDKSKLYPNKSSVNYKTRYCSQDNYKVSINGGFDVKGKNVCNVVLADVKKFKDVDELEQLPEYNAFWVINVKKDIYALIYPPNKKKLVLYKYSTSDKNWEKMRKHNLKLKRFSVCAFMKKLFIIGGHDGDQVTTSSCIKLNTKNCKLKKCKNMKTARRCSACTAFEGRVVVSGGYDDNGVVTNSVEAYDHVANTWSPMPHMIHGRYYHNLVAVRNKLFVFGGFSTESGELFDSCVNKFVLVKPPLSSLGINHSPGAFPIGNKIFVLKNCSVELLTFDIDTSEWNEEAFEITKTTKFYSCLKLPET